jgi:hypothetical protein
MNDIDALTRKIDELPISRSKRELAKAELIAALAIVELIFAITEAIREVIEWKVVPDEVVPGHDADS